jgi:hypothetical protein
LTLASCFSPKPRPQMRCLVPHGKRKISRREADVLQPHQLTTFRVPIPTAARPAFAFSISSPPDLIHSGRGPTPHRITLGSSCPVSAPCFPVVPFGLSVVDPLSWFTDGNLVLLVDKFSPARWSAGRRKLGVYIDNAPAHNSKPFRAQHAEDPSTLFR